ncbi:FAD-binding oxidoreductase [Actinomadura madurae]|uniref:NAD(P)/FAD-dependent oxidoreductase n=1 Tax=Actinomadura madurae TaxID=1993 RepID=UPI0020D209AB|nr:FAD-dependent oxidoreductase [Actinomadura madurae]MCP9970530.1 FAD-binding oxidoreductase [Actinomadura madurae]
MAADAAPRRVAVVGAGMVGLSTAWFLQEHGADVTVFDRRDVAAGASWGNAGLADARPRDPAARTGRPLLRRARGAQPVVARLRPAEREPEPAQVPRRVRPQQHRRAVAARDGVARADQRPGAAELRRAGRGRRRRRDPRRGVLLRRLPDGRGAARPAGGDRAHPRGRQELEYEVLDGDEARRLEPALSEEVGAAILLRGQRFINPGVFVHALADSVRDRGGKIRTGAAVTDIAHQKGSVSVRTTGSDFEKFDTVVLASGVWLGDLARRFGVRSLVQAGRGYSFSVPMARVPDGPVYFPAQRVACTPLGDRLRVAGMMEFRRPEAPLDPRRIRAIVDAARPLLRGADLDARQDEWVGSRPCTRDGLPLIGATRSPRVFAAGGHGMWGITLGPATGNLLAEMIATGRRPRELDPFDPLR